MMISKNDMMNVYEPEGFDFSNCFRDIALCETGMKPPRFTSTGTTTVAAVFKDGVVMGADSRSTQGNMVADKFCDKVHYITNSIFACGAGTSADLHHVTKMISANLRLLELNSGRKARVITAVTRLKHHLFKHQGYVGAYLLVGGVDPTGAHLFQVSANGTSLRRQFVSDGSGSYGAGTVLERDWRFDMTEFECIALVQRALEAGMHGDNMSGNTFRITVINNTGSRQQKPVAPDFAYPPTAPELDYKFKPGSTVVFKQKTIDYRVVESMDVSN